MPSFLRSIRQSRWKKPEWLDPGSGEIKADALLDLQTSNNLLSVYRVESEHDINRITVALAATRDNLQNVGYAVFDDREFQNTGIAIVPSPGKTPDCRVNELHHDIGALTVGQTAALAAIIIKGELGRRLLSAIRSDMKQAIKSGVLDDTAIKEQILRKLR